MPKKTASFTLSTEIIEKVEKISTGLGMSKSEFVEFLVKSFQVSEYLNERFETIKQLQEKTKAKLGLL